MPHCLRYAAGVRLVADPFDPHLWRCAVAGRRYALRERRGTIVLVGADGEALGWFRTWERAVERAAEHAGSVGAGQCAAPARLSARPLPPR